MWIWKFIRKKVLMTRIPIATVNAVMMDIDSNGDGFVSVMEIIDGVKKVMD